MKSSSLTAIAALSAATLVPTVSAQAAPARGVICGGVAGCHVVDRADVDGDGTLDKVAVAAIRAHHGQLRVKLTHGKLFTIRFRTDSTADLARRAYLSAGRMDGVRGDDLLLQWSEGAHSSRYQSFTLRQDGLERLDAPRYQEGGYWTLDDSVESYAGYQRRFINGHLNVFKRVALLRDGGRYRSIIRRFAWRGTHWRLVMAKGTWVQPARARSYGGFDGQWGGL